MDRLDEDEEIGDEDSDEDCALTAEDGEFGCNTIFCKVLSRNGLFEHQTKRVSEIWKNHQDWNVEYWIFFLKLC